MDMYAAYREVGSYSAAAQICGTTPKTVKRAVARARAAEATPLPEAVVEHNYDEVADLIAQRVAKTEGRISAKRLLSVAQAAGYTGSGRNLRRAVADAKTALATGPPPGTAPGGVGAG